MLLADTIHPANALFDPHGVPRHVEVDDDVTELQVQTFTAGIRRNQHAHILGERLLRTGARFQIHAAVERRHRETTAFQEVGQHGLGGHELGEDQHLQRRIAFFLLQLVDQLQQRFSLGIGACGFGLPRQVQQHLNFRLLQLPAAGLHGQVHL